MNILSKLPFMKSDDDQVEADGFETKADRIKFHATSVRNGPIKFNRPTNGQIRRAQRRGAQAAQDRARRHQVNSYFDARREAATLRGMLQHVGLLPFARVDFQPQPHAVLRSTIYLIHTFADAEGTVTVTEGLVRDSLQKALNRYQTLNNQAITLIPEDYVLPVAVAA